MAWRLHLANQAIHHVNIVDGERPLLAVWLGADRAAFYELDSGTDIGECSYPPPATDNRHDEAWQAYIGELIAPNRAVLPSVRLNDLTILLTDDARMRLYWKRNGGVFLDTDGREVQLDLDTDLNIAQVTLDRFLGLNAALETSGKLHIFQQHIKVGQFEFDELQWDDDARPMLAMTRGGGTIFVCDGRRIVLTDTSGKTRKFLDPHYYIRRLACSPDGAYIVTGDLDTGVMRVYDGDDLTLLYQKFAIDLMAHAIQVQLIADLPPTSVAPSSLSIDNDGVIAFAMSGVVCVSHVTEMDEIPRPQALL